MIGIARGPEPEALRLERRQRLARAILARREGSPVTFDGYQVAREALVPALNYKCAYCEMPLQIQGPPVEHFRPKECVENEGEPRDASRYWWLAWTWENLLFACSRCNTWSKKNKFPLAPGSSPLAEFSVALDKERPLLIDPARVNPREHIRFKWSEARGRWLPLPVNGSALGRRTIDELRLAVIDDGADHAKAHVEDRLSLCIEQLREAMSGGSGKDDREKVKRLWARWCRSLFAPRQPFHALTWDVLDAEFSAEERSTWGLTLPRLGRHEPPASSPLFDPADDPPGFGDLSEELQLRVRALGRHSSEQEVLGVLEEILRPRRGGRDWSDQELAGLLGRSIGSVRLYRRRLEERRSLKQPRGARKTTSRSREA
ncbi:HNH endonuclease [Chondromyces apiculatus]|uniref:HNH domain-containing protein n=1 Tax=Chondromyces apiculatus DSM 436 TaxID=1192034 RepID=A0A017T4K4_9BACT|nr:hypothetical protein [Chondromyces apiculatus]EYF04188.1 Hypothetical protein CAP_4665 [Chondromyces apiculatus DSM 436]